jgi:uncharacterized protein (TIGR03067 family)
MRTVTLAALLAALAPHAPALQQPQPRAKTDADLLQGKWLIVGLETGGKAEPERNYKGNTLTFTKDRATLREAGFPEIEFAYSLDPMKAPKAIDLTTRNATIHGIYKMEGDDLTLCLSVGGTRPTDFATRAGADTEMFALKRNYWEPYTDRTFGYTVDFPGRPQERRRKADTPAGELTTTIRIARHDGERVSYLVSVTPLPGKPAAGITADVIDAVRDLLLSEVDAGAKATVDREQPLSGKGPANGKEFTVGLESPNSKTKGTARVRLFVIGDRVYGLMAAGTEEAVKAADVAKFWRSFGFPGGKKKG